MKDKLLRLDSRGRVSIATAVRKNGIEPSALWRLTFGEYGTLTLTPVTVQTQIPKEIAA